LAKPESRPETRKARVYAIDAVLSLTTSIFNGNMIGAAQHCRICAFWFALDAQIRRNSSCVQSSCLPTQRLL
jgi:hypothetical protein